ncbi:MAG: hypothetical protein ACD_71C00042G0003 [uncultured bacterium (gcode 4)]|uniref:Uncharacterized protein n=1 Tax=uncultured bacterium (gcode 4) TaxID=1234023 RepID=K1YP53_9BACT|nr:MAG: hypothetical protein ACD_71C00042G0003 [uncultured bacterium (gcode 4)]
MPYTENIIILLKIYRNRIYGFKKIPLSGYFWFFTGGERRDPFLFEKTPCDEKPNRWLFPRFISFIGITTVSNLPPRVSAWKTKHPFRGVFLFFLAERGRFELPVGCPTHPFQGCALGHYATSPYFTLSFWIYFSSATEDCVWASL